MLSKLADLTVGAPLSETAPGVRRQRGSAFAIARSRHRPQGACALAARADLVMVGIGQINNNAQLFVDGFISRDELIDLIRNGAVGEIASWAFDDSGQILDSGTNRRTRAYRYRWATIDLWSAWPWARTRSLHSCRFGGAADHRIDHERRHRQVPLERRLTTPDFSDPLLFAAPAGKLRRALACIRIDAMQHRIHLTAVSFKVSICSKQGQMP